MGSSASGRAVAAYFIMGRSANSRNRVFAARDDGIYTEPFDASRVEDPSLIIYRAAAACGNRLIVTNGDQTDTVREGLQKGLNFAESLRSRKYEPDAPNYTPRISGMITFAEGGFTYELSILKKAAGEAPACGRYTFAYEPLPGTGHFIHTYITDGDPLPSFEGEPEEVEVPDDIDVFAGDIWETLDADNRISLYVIYIDPRGGEKEERIINKNR